LDGERTGDDGCGREVNPAASRLVLGSRSPRRLELLRQIHPADRIEVVPPSTTDEAGFAKLHDWPSIEARLLEIASAKCDDVASQVRTRLSEFNPNSVAGSPSPPTPLPQGERGTESRGIAQGENLPNTPHSPLSPRGRGAGGEGADAHSTSLADPTPPIIIAADTVVIVERGEDLHVLGQPPADDSWQDTVRRWFREDFAGKTHLVATALVLEDVASGKRASRVVTSRVTFVADVDRWLDWYLATGEPCGKAGGYALQGAGSVFISKVEGSLSNVVGLPLAELLELLAAWS
jgi:predicted house-cleaning NTP pyrophosphatase (Maf/HAM1 superfamily)